MPCNHNCYQGRRCVCGPVRKPELYLLYRYARDHCRMGRVRAIWKALDWGFL